MCIEIWPTMPEWVCLSRMAWPYNNVRWPPPCEDLEKGGKTWIYTIQEMHKHLYASLLLHFKLQQDQFLWHTTKPKINTTLRWVKTRTLWQCLASQWQGGYNRNSNKNNKIQKKAQRKTYPFIQIDCLKQAKEKNREGGQEIVILSSEKQCENVFRL